MSAGNKPAPFMCVVKMDAAKKKANILIDGRIGRYWNGAEAFKFQVESLVASGIADAHVYVNTEGGSVFEANEIVNIIKKFTGTVTGEGGALVASAGTYIAMNLTNFTMPSNGQWMHHKPMSEIFGNEDQIVAELKLLQNLTSQYRKEYATKMGITEAEFEAQWAKGDQWYNAEQALAAGLIAGITDEAPVTQAMYDRIAACGSKTPPKINTEPKTKIGTMEIKATALGLPADATDAQIQAKLDELQGAARENASLKTAQADAAKAVKAMNIKNLLDAAELAHKINATTRPSFERLAEADYDSAKAAIDGLQPVQALSGKIGSSNGSTTKVDAKWDDLMEDNAKGARALAKDNPEAFKAAFVAEFGEGADEESILTFYSK